MSSNATRIVLVRHGETVWHAENRYAGISDIALTRKGEQQALNLAAWAKNAKLAAVYASTLSRAVATAIPVAAVARVMLQTSPDLVELDFGLGEGLTDQEMNAKFPEARAAFRVDPVTHHLPGGENPTAAVNRAMSTLQKIASAHEGDRVLVVAHNTLIRLTLCHLLQIPLARYRSTFPHLANGTLTEIEFRPTGVALLSFNSPLVQEQM